jgi:hypothetical protein
MRKPLFMVASAMALSPVHAAFAAETRLRCAFNDGSVETYVIDDQQKPFRVHSDGTLGSPAPQATISATEIFARWDQANYVLIHPANRTVSRMFAGDYSTGSCRPARYLSQLKTAGRRKE